MLHSVSVGTAIVSSNNGLATSGMVQREPVWDLQVAGNELRAVERGLSNLINELDPEGLLMPACS